jgi:hypothetical protein
MKGNIVKNEKERIQVSVYSNGEMVRERTAMFES